MPSRMSLRRTKPRHAIRPSTSRPRKTHTYIEESRNTSSSRQELNLKTPRKLRSNDNDVAKDSSTLGVDAMVHIDNTLVSPLKLLESPLKTLERGLNEKMRSMSVSEKPLSVDSHKVLEAIREKFKRPGPLSVKKRVANSILEGLFDSVLKESNAKDPIIEIIEWNSPKKSHDSPKKSSLIKSFVSPKKTVALDVELSKITRSEMNENTNKTPEKMNLSQLENKAESGDGPIIEIDDDDDNFEKEAEFALKIKNKAKKTPQKGNEPKDEIVEANMKTDDFTDANTKMVAESQEKVTSRKTEGEDEMESKMNVSIVEIDDGQSASDQVTDKFQKDEKTPQIDSEIKSKDDISDGKIAEDEDNKKVESQNVMTDDDSSTSTFQLPPEFFADDNSNDSLNNILETPNTRKTVNIEKDSSLEISNNDSSVNIDVVKMEEGNNKEFLNSLDIGHKSSLKCSLKFSKLKSKRVDMDLECFKNQYLNEIGKDLSLKDCTNSLKKVTDFSLPDNKDWNEQLKRKAKGDDDVVSKKKRKKNKNKNIILRYHENTGKSPKTYRSSDNPDKDSDIEIVCSKNTVNKIIDLTVATGSDEKVAKRRKKIKKRDRKGGSARENIHVKIKLKNGGVNLQITKTNSEEKKKKKKRQQKEMIPHKKMKQYILKSPTEMSSNVLCKPDIDVTPKKRSYVKSEKTEKTPDKLKQTSIHNFFKLKYE